MPLANGFLRKADLSTKEEFFPLGIHFCRNCGLAQLVDIVQKEALFAEYAYFSSISKTFVDHSESLAREIAEKFVFSKGSVSGGDWKQ